MENGTNYDESYLENAKLIWDKDKMEFVELTEELKERLKEEARQRQLFEFLKAKPSGTYY